MGDRVHASVAIGGHLETIDEAEELADALVAESFYDSNTDEKVEGEEDAMTIMRYAVENKQTISFYDHEVNYGNFDSIDAAAHTIPGIVCVTSFDSGGDFSEGRKTILHVDGQVTELHVSTHGGAPTIELRELEEALHKARLDADPLAEIDKLIAETKRAAGDGIPPLTASPAVSAWLKIFADKAA